MAKNTVSGIILAVLLSGSLTLASSVQLAEVQAREVGAQVSDWARYDVTGNFTTNDPSYASGYQPQFAQIEHFKAEVLSVAGTNITFQATTYFKNGTETLDVLWLDISGSLIDPLPFFTWAILFTATNLTVGDPLFPNPMSSLVNATSMRTYAGEEREVNFIKRSSASSMRRASPPKEEYIDQSTTCMFWDRATGVLVEANDTATHYRIELGMGYHQLPGGYVYETETFTQMVLNETNMWPRPVPFWLQWWFYVAVVVVVASLGGAVYLVRKRKPRVVTPSPLEGADKIGSASS